MRSYATTSGCRLEYLRRCLDDPAAVPCGRCDRCAGGWFPTEVSEEALDAARAHLGRPGVSLAPRQLWPTGLAVMGVPLSGRIPPGEQAWPGRAVGRLSDLGWGGRLRSLLADGAPDQPVPDDVFGAVVQTLAAWARGDDAWAQRPVGVVTVGSRRRPRLVAHLGERIAGVGRLPLLGSVSVAGPAAPARANSAQRVKALYDGFTVPPLPAGLDGPVLLVDDLVDTGWTMALVARLLRQAGAPAVLPFALALSA